MGKIRIIYDGSQLKMYDILMPTEHDVGSFHTSSYNLQLDSFEHPYGKLAYLQKLCKNNSLSFDWCLINKFIDKGCWVGKGKRRTPLNPL